MLLFDDPCHLDFALFLQPFRRCVPPGHVHAVTRSPRSKNVQDQFLPPEVRDRASPTTVEGRKNHRWKHLAFMELGLCSERFGSPNMWELSSPWAATVFTISISFRGHSPKAAMGPALSTCLRRMKTSRSSRKLRSISPAG